MICISSNKPTNIQHQRNIPIYQLYLLGKVMMRKNGYRPNSNLILFGSMTELSKLSLSQLLELAHPDPSEPSSDNPSAPLLHLLTHSEIVSSIKNQSPLLRKIFTYPHVSLLTTFLQREDPLHAQMLSSVRFDPSGQSIPLCLRLPHAAMQIFSCECALINDMLFAGAAPEHPSPLLPSLLRFLDGPPHYHLACYFARVMTAITKRVSSVSHKYNSAFAEWVLGGEGALYRSGRHLYSLSTLDYLTKWLLLSSRRAVEVEAEGERVLRQEVQFRKREKLDFLLGLVEGVNALTLPQDCLNNVAALFDQLLTQTEKSNKLASSLMIKSLPTPTPTKVTLYDFAADEEVVGRVLAGPQQGCLSVGKLLLVKVYLSRYAAELELLLKEKEDDQECKLLQAVTAEQLQSLLDWLYQHLRTLMRITPADNSADSPPRPKEPTDSRVSLAPSAKMQVLHLLETLRMVHGLSSLRGSLVEYFNVNSGWLVGLVRRLMELENNLIQLETGKIVLGLLRRGSEVPYDFARKLLPHAILQLVEVDSARPHVIEWADIVLGLERQHIFEDYEEEFEWEHIRETVAEVKKLQVGQYRFVQAQLDSFYSEEKALLKYSSFLSGFKAEVTYEEKKENKYTTLSQRKADPTLREEDAGEAPQEAVAMEEFEKEEREKPFEPEEKGEDVKEASLPATPQVKGEGDAVEVVLPSVSWLDHFSSNYLHFDINHLMDQL